MSETNPAAIKPAEITALTGAAGTDVAALTLTRLRTAAEDHLTAIHLLKLGALSGTLFLAGAAAWTANTPVSQRLSVGAVFTAVVAIVLQILEMGASKRSSEATSQLLDHQNEHIAELTRKMEGWHLLPEQLARLSEKMKPFAGIEVKIGKQAGAVESNGLIVDFKWALEHAGWKVVSAPRAPSFMGGMTKGVMIHGCDNRDLVFPRKIDVVQAASALAAAISEEGITAKSIETHCFSDNTEDASFEDHPTVDLYVGDNERTGGLIGEIASLRGKIADPFSRIRSPEMVRALSPFKGTYVQLARISDRAKPIAYWNALLDTLRAAAWKVDADALVVLNPSITHGVVVEFDPEAPANISTAAKALAAELGARVDEKPGLRHQGLGPFHVVISDDP